MNLRPILLPHKVWCLIALTGLLLTAPNTSAQIQWRVSVKFILDASGNRASSGNINEDSEVEAQIDTANAVLDAMGRGFRLQLVEIVDLNGVDQWFDSAPTVDNRNALEETAKENTALYAWSSSAINIYINGADSGGAPGICSLAYNGFSTILLRQGIRDTTFIHEIGHFMGLCHTQGCICGPCGTDDGQCNSPESDDIFDTLPDLPCWNRDDIANNAFGQDYSLLTSLQQMGVDWVRFNVMSYHNNRDRFTPDQLDLISVMANLERTEVVNGYTIFVNAENPLCFIEFGLAPSCDFFGPLNLGNIVQGPAQSVAFAENLASAYGPNSVVLIRGGTYDEDLTLHEPATYRATRGDVFLRNSPNPFIP